MKQRDVFGSALLKGGKKNIIPPETSPRALNFFNIYLYSPYLHAKSDFFLFSPSFSNSSATFQQLLCCNLWREDRGWIQELQGPLKGLKTHCCLMCVKCLCAFSYCSSLSSWAHLYKLNQQHWNVTDTENPSSTSKMLLSVRAVWFSFKDQMSGQILNCRAWTPHIYFLGRK